MELDERKLFERTKDKLYYQAYMKILHKHECIKGREKINNYLQVKIKTSLYECVEKPLKMLKVLYPENEDTLKLITMYKGLKCTIANYENDEDKTYKDSCFILRQIDLLGKMILKDIEINQSIDMQTELGENSL